MHARVGNRYGEPQAVIRFMYLPTWGCVITHVWVWPMGKGLCKVDAEHDPWTLHVQVRIAYCTRGSSSLLYCISYTRWRGLHLMHGSGARAATLVPYAMYSRSSWSSYLWPMNASVCKGVRVETYHACTALAQSVVESAMTPMHVGGTSRALHDSRCTMHVWVA